MPGDALSENSVSNGSCCGEIVYSRVGRLSKDLKWFKKFFAPLIFVLFTDPERWTSTSGTGKSVPVSALVQGKDDIC